MPNNELPNLSAWHRVPAGATIPAGTAFAYAYADGLNIKLNGYSRDITVGEGNYPHYTGRPIALPLPTEEGATILATDDDRPPRILLTLEAGQWVSSLGLRWSVEEFRAWCPVTLGETVVAR